MAMRAILNAAAGETVDTILVCPTAGAVRRIAGGDVQAEGYLAEAAGRPFFERFESSAVASAEKPASGSRSNDAESDANGEEYDGKGGKGSPGASVLKLSPLLKDVALYPLLGISEGASTDEVKKAYRSMALACHPDKLGRMSEEEAKKVQENFIKIQEAYEILSDPAKRQLYDSSLPFDESFPKFKQGDGQDFYEVFREVFHRNARFSQKRPVPDIGGPETTLQEVKRFYDFWFGFQSWRDPLMMAQADGHELQDLEEAECREEKRWMIRENNRIGKKYKQAEKERVCQLAALAEKNDPRLLAEKEAKRAARAAEAARREKERMAVQTAREEEERKRREEEEKAMAIEAERRKVEKNAKDAARAELKKCRQRLRAFHSAVEGTVLFDQLNEVCLQLGRADLERLSDNVETTLASGSDGASAATALIYSAIESLGLKPVLPAPKGEKPEDDTVSTSSGGPSEASTPTPHRHEDDPSATAARQQKEAQRQREAAERRRIEEEERARLVAQAAEDRKRRDEQRRKDEQAAEAKRRQQEKKERERAKKEEEKKRKAEQEEQQKREMQREQARQRAEEQAEKDRAAAIAEDEERKAERVAKLFEEDRLERLDALSCYGAEDLAAELERSLAADASLRGAVHLLKEAEIDEEQRKDCLMVLLNRVSLIWQLGLAPPTDIKLSSNVRNLAKKARLRLREAALGFFGGLQAKAGADDVAAVTAYQRGMVEGLYEWPIWTAEEREEELRLQRATASSAEEVTESAAVGTGEAAAEAVPDKKKKKGSKNGKKVAGEEEEDLNALFAEFGVTIEEKKSKKKRR